MEITQKISAILGMQQYPEAQLRQLSSDLVTIGPPIRLCIKISLSTLKLDPRHSATAGDFFNKLKLSETEVIKSLGSWQPNDIALKGRLDKLKDILVHSGVKSALYLHATARGIKLVEPKLN